MALTTTTDSKGDSMKSFKDLLGAEFSPEVIKTFKCICDEEVQEIKLIHQFGPFKGQEFTSVKGCKCEDYKNAKEAKDIHKKLKLDKIQQKLNDNSFVNSSLKKSSFDNYKPTSKELEIAFRKVVSYVKDFSVETSGNLLLAGSYGTGKSHLSISTVKKLTELGFKCLFISVPKLLTKIKESYGSDSEFSEAQFMKFVSEVDLLVLDDLGAEHSKNTDDWTEAKLFEVIDGRAGKPTIYTTNLSSKELEKQVGPRNFSRIFENVEVVKMAGKDYRRKDF